MTTILVTGGYGFIGRHVAKAAAERGHRVIGLGHGAWTDCEFRDWGFRDWLSADVTAESVAAIAGQSSVIMHCAGSGSVPFSLEHPDRDFDRTIGSTRAILEFIRRQRPDIKLVIPSSAGVYGRAEAQPIRLTAPLNPVSPYGLHKRMAEDLCRSYGRHFGLSCAIIRLFSVYGIGLKKQLLWDACTKIAAGRRDFAGTGDETRDWLHCDDAAGLLLAGAGAANPACPIVNGGSGLAITIRQVVEAIIEEFDAPFAPEFSGAIRPGDPSHYQADITEALGWGWAPQRELRTEIGDYVRWFKSLA